MYSNSYQIEEELVFPKFNKAIREGSVWNNSNFIFFSIPFNESYTIRVDVSENLKLRLVKKNQIEERTINYCPSSSMNTEMINSTLKIRNEYFDCGKLSCPFFFTP